MDFEERFDVSIAETYPGLVEALVDERFLISDNSTIRLSPKGVLLADSIVENFVHDGKNLPQRQGSSAGDNLGVLRVA